MWPLVATHTRDINIDSNCSRIRDPDTVLSSSPDPDVTMALGASVNHSARHGPGSSVDLRHLGGGSFPRHQSSMITGTADINIDLSHRRDRGLDMSIGSHSP